MYDGPERRRTMDKEIVDLKIEVASLTSMVKTWMAGTDEYRRKLCDKQEVILTKISKLPCDKREGRYTMMTWVFVTMILAVVADIIMRIAK
jgi:hypothetical protein